ncbi:MAG: hypothetical protein NC397_01110 [Clostridium sp.]|nr:hypothetical protein [Clostridium sp.]
MDKEKAVEIVKKYKGRVRTIQALGIGLTACVLAFAPVNMLYRILIVLCLIIIAAVVYNKTVKRNIDNILYNDCNPRLYYLVTKGMGFNNIAKDIDVAYFIGDFNKAYQLCTYVMHKAPQKAKPFYLKTLCSIQFLSGNFDDCKDTYNRLIEAMNRAKYSDKVKAYYTSIPEFFLYFIDGSYDKALEQLNKCENVKKAANTYRNIIKYYYALTYYYSGKFDLAEQFFKDTAATCPAMYIAESSEKYLSESSIIKFPQIPLTDTKNNMDIADTQLPKIKPSKILVLCALLILIVILVVSIINLNTGTMEDTLSKNDIQINEICKTLCIDENYTICIFNTEDYDIGVSLFENKADDKYKYCISYTGIDDMMISDGGEYYVTASGTSPRIQFGITEDDSIPDNYQSVHFTSYNKSYCFYYTIGEEEYHFANISGIVTE